MEIQKNCWKKSREIAGVNREKFLGELKKIIEEHRRNYTRNCGKITGQSIEYIPGESFDFFKYSGGDPEDKIGIFLKKLVKKSL